MNDLQRAVSPAQKSRAGATLWPLGIAMAYGSFAAFMIGFAIWSAGHKEELVSADYYARTVTHQRQMDAVARARPLAVNLSLAPDRASLRLDHPPGLAADARAVEVHLYRPSSQALDQVLQTRFDTTGTSTLALSSPLATGLWRASVGWEMDGVGYRVESSFVAR